MYGSNRYASQVLMLNARNVYEDTISPPADLSITQANFVTQTVGLNVNRFNPQTSLILKRIGVYSNFADGLVFKNANESFDIGLTTFYPLITNQVTLSGATITFDVTSKTVTGVGTSFNTEVNAGDDIKISAGLDYIKVASVTNATTMVLADYPKVGGDWAGLTYVTGAGGSSTQYNIEDIRVLNEMVEVNRLLLNQSGSINNEDLLIQVAVNPDQVFYQRYTDVEFLTKSISTDYADDAVHFDVVMEVEVTQA